MKFNKISPWARGTTLLIAIIGTLLAHRIGVMLVVWLGIIVPLLLIAGLHREHGRFALTVLLPVGIALFLVWGNVVGAPPGQGLHTNPAAGSAFAFLVTLRLALLGGITQLGLLTIAPEDLVRTLRSWGLRGDKLVIAMSTLAIWPEVKLRAEQILTARYARGLVSKLNFIEHARNLPYICRPLFAWVLRSSIQRSETWEQRLLPDRLESVSPSEIGGSFLAELFFVTLAVLWLAYNLIDFWTSKS